MLRQVKNETLLLKNIFGTISNETYDSISILSAESVITPEFVSLPAFVQTTVCAFGWINTAIYSYFRLIVYKYFWGQYRRKKLENIYVLTCLVCLFQHLFIIAIQTHETLIVSFGISFEAIIGTTLACIPLNLVISFEQFYTVIGTLGIAIYRILLIKHSDFVNYKIGEKRLLGIIVVCGIGLTMLLSFDALKLLDPLRPKCMLVPKHNVLQILDDYGQSIEMLPFKSLITTIRVSTLFVMVSFTFIELGIYISIFLFIYKHDNSENLRRILDYQCIKARNKKNAVTFFAQFCSFVIKLFFTIVCINAIIFGSSNNYVFFVLSILKRICLSSMAVIEVLTSSTLRSKVKIF